MSVVALLPMKAHSERVPNKNIKLFAGKPLYHHVADVLESSELIDSIIINTDSDTITGEALKYFSKVKVNKRPKDLCGDFVPMNDIIAYDIQTIKAEHFIQTHSTNPLLSLATLEKGISQYFEGVDTYDSLFSVTRYQGRFYRESGEALNHNPQELLRTQDLSPIFEENSNIFLFSKSSFNKAGNKRIGLKPQMFVMDKLEAVDIDDWSDWDLAEMIYELRGRDCKI